MARRRKNADTEPAADDTTVAAPTPEDNSQAVKEDADTKAQEQKAEREEARKRIASIRDELSTALVENAWNVLDLWRNYGAELNSAKKLFKSPKLFGQYVKENDLDSFAGVTTDKNDRTAAMNIANWDDELFSIMRHMYPDVGMPRAIVRYHKQTWDGIHEAIHRVSETADDVDFRLDAPGKRPKGMHKDEWHSILEDYKSANEKARQKVSEHLQAEAEDDKTDPVRARTLSRYCDMIYNADPGDVALGYAGYVKRMEKPSTAFVDLAPPEAAAKLLDTLNKHPQRAEVFELFKSAVLDDDVFTIERDDDDDDGDDDE